jgi:hypothetical protein
MQRHVFLTVATQRMSGGVKHHLPWPRFVCAPARPLCSLSCSLLYSLLEDLMLLVEKSGLRGA